MENEIKYTHTHKTMILWLQKNQGQTVEERFHLPLIHHYASTAGGQHEIFRRNNRCVKYGNK